MAKSVAKKPAKSPKKKASARKTPSSIDLIVAACEVSLAKLNALDIEHALQSEINWCLGSFNNDQNPIGLYHMTERSLLVFQGELSKKTKGITTKLLKDLEKALHSA